MGLARRALLLFPVTAILSTGSPLVAGNSYGIYDARGLGMGGVGMSTGDLRTGHFYNPSLLAFHRGDEDQSKHGQHTLSAVLGPMTGSAESAVDAARDDLESRLSDAVANFNAAPDAQSAAHTADAATDLRQLLEDVNGEDITGEAYAGYSVTEPGDRAGGAFFMGVRAIGGGDTEIATEDLAMLDDYIAALRTGDPTAISPSMVGEDGQLLDPMDRLNSAARTQAVVLAEVGVSFARQFTLLDQSLALGVSPKIIRARAFDDQWSAAGGEFGSQGSVDDDIYMNLDIGAAFELDGRYRLAVAGKDIINKSFATDGGPALDLNGRYRAGLSYFTERYTFGMEMDLLGSKSLGSGLKRQDVSIGGEYEIGSFLDLRAGYRIDARNNFGDMLTAGIGLQVGFATLELSVATGADNQSVGLQVGILH